MTTSSKGKLIKSDIWRDVLTDIPNEIKNLRLERLKRIFAFNNYVEKFASKCLIEPRNPPLLILQRIENKIVFGRHFYGKSLKCLICIKFVYVWITSIITAVAKTNYNINSLGFQILHLKNENTNMLIWSFILAAWLLYS